MKLIKEIFLLLITLFTQCVINAAALPEPYYRMAIRFTDDNGKANPKDTLLLNIEQCKALIYDSSFVQNSLDSDQKKELGLGNCWCNNCSKDSISKSSGVFKKRKNNYISLLKSKVTQLVVKKIVSLNLVHEDMRKQMIAEIHSELLVDLVRAAQYLDSALFRDIFAKLRDYVVIHPQELDRLDFLADGPGFYHEFNDVLIRNKHVWIRPLTYNLSSSSGYYDKVHIWNENTSQLVATLTPYKDNHHSIDYEVQSPDGKFSASVFRDSNLHISDTSTKEKIYRAIHTPPLRSTVAWGRDSKQLAWIGSIHCSNETYINMLNASLLRYKLKNLTAGQVLAASLINNADDISTIPAYITDKLPDDLLDLLYCAKAKYYYTTGTTDSSSEQRTLL